MSAKDSASLWYVAGTGGGTVDYPTAAHGVTATFASSTMVGKFGVILDAITIIKVGATGEAVEIVGPTGTNVFSFTTTANAAASMNRLPFFPNGLEMGAGFGLKMTQTDWLFLIQYRLR